ncbi:MAG: hypothetical protein GY783_07105 [Gammaproteobacteria bacterium]|nr:hypothetical protein [Gammaproteobacteria bacterium]
MAFENTITEQDMDINAQQIVQGFRNDAAEIEPDLAVDGLSDSILSRLLGLFGAGRA